MQETKLLDIILQKMAQDSAFLTRLKANPNKVLKDECGVDFEEKVKIWDEHPEERIFVLPPQDFKTNKKFPEKMNAREYIFNTGIQNSEFRAKVKENPRKVLKEAGYSIPEDCEIKIIESKSHEKNLVIPQIKSHSELHPNSLKEINAAFKCCSCTWSNSKSNLGIETLS